MRVFKQLTLTDRIRIEKWLKDGLRVKEIADRLRVDPSTVYRELKRGSYDKLDGKTWKLIPTYSPDIAEQRYQAHLREKGPNLKIGKDHELASYIEQTIIDRTVHRLLCTVMPWKKDGHSKRIYRCLPYTATSKRACS